MRSQKLLIIISQVIKLYVRVYLLVGSFYMTKQKGCVANVSKTNN